jgi:hypothetical protein
MSPEKRLTDWAAQGTRFFVRGYDSKNDRWLFATDDPEEAPIAIGMDRSNPRRNAIHNTLMEIASRKNPGREGVQFTLGSMPVHAEGDNPNVNEGQVQILDIEETELSREGRKVIVENKVVGEWSQDLDRAVHRFADTMVMDKALAETVRLDGNKQIFQAAIWAKARTFALQELGYKKDDPRLSEEVFKKFAPTSMQEAIYGAEPGPDGKLRRFCYNPLESQEVQNPTFADMRARSRTLQPGEMGNLHQMAINYGVQRALSEHVGEVCGVDLVLKKAEESLIEQKNLLYGHPKKSDEDYRLSSREAGRQLGANAISGLMHGSSEHRGEMNGWIPRDDLHIEVLAELERMPNFSTLTKEQRTEAYLTVSLQRLDQYGLRGRQAVYAEQIKVAVAEKKQHEEDKSPKAHEIGLGALGLAGKGVHHVTNALVEIERAPSFSM